MQDQGKRLLLAVVLALGVFAAWSLIAKQEEPAKPAQTASETIGSAAAPASAHPGQAPAVPQIGPPEASPGEPPVPAEAATIDMKTWATKKWVRDDVLTDITQRFPHEDLNAILSLLDEYQGAERARVQIAILKLSEGNLAKLRHFIQAAQTDYRDVIYWAFYDRNDKEIPFP